MRRFVLRRSVDVSGVSGLGDVAEGIRFSDGTAVIRWCTGEHRSTVIWSSVEAAEAVHGHNGATRVHWLDPEPPKHLFSVPQDPFMATLTGPAFLNGAPLPPAA